MFGVIYKITNLINGKTYIGQTINGIKKRFRQHYCNTNKTIIGRAINKYGKENFEIKILAICNSMEEMNHRESYYIKLFNSLSPNGYNLNGGGGNSRPCPETIKKLSDSHKGLKHTEEQRKKISISNSGKVRTEEHRKKYSKSKDYKKIKVFCHQNQTIYNSILEAANTLNIPPTNLGMHLMGKLKRVGSYTFSKVNGVNEIIPTIFIEKLNKHVSKKKSVKCNQNGTVYSSMTEAASNLGLKSPGKIAEVISGKLKQYRGYTFQYSKDGQ